MDCLNFFIFSFCDPPPPFPLLILRTMTTAIGWGGKRGIGKYLRSDQLVLAGVEGVDDI
jgi:hypothetical protein